MKVVYGDLLDKCIFFNICRPTLMVRLQLFFFWVHYCMYAVVYCSNWGWWKLSYRMTMGIKKFTMRLLWEPKPNQKLRFFLRNLPKPTDGRISETVTTLIKFPGKKQQCTVEWRQRVHEVVETRLQLDQTRLNNVRETHLSCCTSHSLLITNTIHAQY